MWRGGIQVEGWNEINYSLALTQSIKPVTTVALESGGVQGGEGRRKGWCRSYSGLLLTPPLCSVSGLPLGSTGSLTGDYLPPSFSQRSIFSDIPPTPGSGSITIPGSLESKHGCICALNKPVVSIRKTKILKLNVLNYS